MSEHHRIALANHCRFGFETMNPLFVFADRRTSIVLTVNSGYE